MVLESNRCAQTAHTGAMHSIINNHEALREMMEISSHRMDDCSRRANEMLSLMDKLCLNSLASQSLIHGHMLLVMLRLTSQPDSHTWIHAPCHA